MERKVTGVFAALVLGLGALTACGDLLPITGAGRCQYFVEDTSEYAFEGDTVDVVYRCTEQASGT